MSICCFIWANLGDWTEERRSVGMLVAKFVVDC